MATVRVSKTLPNKSVRKTEISVRDQPKISFRNANRSCGRNIRSFGSQFRRFGSPFRSFGIPKKSAYQFAEFRRTPNFGIRRAVLAFALIILWLRYASVKNYPTNRFGKLKFRLEMNRKSVSVMLTEAAGEISEALEASSDASEVTSKASEFQRNRRTNLWNSEGHQISEFRSRGQQRRARSLYCGRCINHGVSRCQCSDLLSL